MTTTSVQPSTDSLPLSAQDAPRKHKYTFPPFPVAPEGVTIISFKDFKEHGIQLSGNPSEVERDGLGIPTIALPRKAKNEAEISKNKKRKKGSATVATAPPAKKGEWWEEWEDEKPPAQSYNPKSTPVERFHEAAADFQKFRNFPPPFHYQLQTGSLQELWDHFRRFAGVLESMQIDSNYAEQDSDGEFDEDQDGSKFVPGEDQSPSDQVYEMKADDAEIEEIAVVKKEDNADIFLRDPERGVKVFLSSYMKSKGLIWKKLYLVYAPHLLRFFVNYLLQNNVLPEQTPGLKAALQVVDLAAKELTRSVAISAALPDGFAIACQGHWGRKADGCFIHDSDDDVVEPDTKHAKLDVEPATPLSDDKQPDAEMPHGAGRWGSSEWGAHDGHSSTVFAAANEPDAPLCEDKQPDVDMAWGNNGGWGSSEWGASDAPLSTATNDCPSVAPIEMDSWTPAAVPSLLSLLGPTALPLTHTPGVVEWSVRRIKSISAPQTAPEPEPAVVDECAADAVERHLARRMTRVEMVPWPRWDGDTELSQPRILKSSRDRDAGADAGVGPGVHDLLADTITLLLGPAAAETLCVGMGLGGTWVQLARESGDVRDNDGKSESAVRKRMHWYLEDFIVVLPSYWTA